MHPHWMDTSRCPLCGGPNGCRMADHGGNIDECWCRDVCIDAALLKRVPPQLRERTCICRQCATVDKDGWPSLRDVAEARLARVRRDR